MAYYVHGNTARCWFGMPFTLYHCLSRWKSPWHPNTINKSSLMILRRFFLPKSGFLYPSPWEEVEYVHLKDFLKNECVLYLKQSLTSPPARSLLLTAPRIIDLPFNVTGDHLSLSLEMTNYATLFLKCKLEMTHTSCWSVHVQFHQRWVSTTI